MTVLSPEQQLAQALGIPYTILQMSINGHAINYLMCGSGAPLLLMHGANFGWGAWYRNIPELARHFTVYAMDLPGTGRSSGIDFNKAGIEKIFVDIIDAFVAKNSLKDVMVIGHSFGGWVALALAAWHRCYLRSIVVSNPLGLSRYLPWKYRPIAIRWVAKLLTTTAIKPTREHIRKFIINPMENIPHISELFISYVCDMIVKNPNAHPILFLNSLFSPFRIKSELVLASRLASISIPVFVMISENDPLLPVGRARKIVERIPRVRTMVFSETGHVIPMERPVEFNRLVTGFASHPS